MNSSKFSLSLTFIILFLFPVTSTGQVFDWAQTANSSSGVFIKSTLFDSNGNLYTTGYSFENTSFGNYTINTPSFFVIKYNSEGHVIWAKFGKGIHNSPTKIVIDKDENIYMIGGFYDQITFDEMTLEGTYFSQGYITKISNSGKTLWARRLGDLTDGAINDVTHIEIGQENDLYISGYFQKYLNFEDGYSLKTNDNNVKAIDAFIAKLNTDGQTQWLKGAGSKYHNRPCGLKMGENGSIYFSMFDIREFSNDSKTVTFKYDEFEYTFSKHTSAILEIDQNGNLKWIKSLDGFIKDIDIDEKEHLYISGSFETEIEIDSKYHFKAESGNFIIKYSPDKAISWAKKIGNEALQNLFLQELNDQIYVADHFSESFVSEKYNLKAISDRDIFILKMEGSGCEEWIKHIEGSYRTILSSLSISNKNKLAIAGIHAGTSLTFDDHTIYNSTNNWFNMFVAVLSDGPINKINPVLKPDKEIICLNEKALLSAESSYGEKINWYKDGELYLSSFSKEIEVDLSGEFFFKINEGTFCEKTSNKVSILKVETPHGDLSVFPNSQTCDAESIRIEAPNKLGFSYQWYRNGQLLSASSNYKLDATESGSYYAIISNQENCTTQTNEVTLEILPPESDFLPDTVYRCINETITLSPSNLKYNSWNYLWSSGETTSGIDIQNEGRYELKIHKDACSYISTVYVKNFEDLVVPNIITPNDDQVNDYFEIINLSNPVQLSIYNRWGKLLFADENYLNNWKADGIENGVYFYFLKSNSKCWKDKKGWIQVLR